MKNIALFAVFVVFFLNACNMPKSKNIDQLDTIFKNYHEQNLKFFPLTSTALGESRYNHAFPNSNSIEFNQNLIDFHKSILESLAVIDTSSLDENRKLSYKVMLWESQTWIEALTITDQVSLIPNGPAVICNMYPIDQFWTHNLTIGQLASGKSNQPFNSIQDYENWLQRVDAYILWCDSAIANFQRGIVEGYVLPKSLVEKIIPQIESFSQGPVKNHVFYMPVLSFPDSTTKSDQDRITIEYYNMVEGKVIPVYQRMYDFFNDEYLPHARETDGIGALPAGKKMYDFLIRYYTTTDLSAEEIFKIGEQEVARISEQMMIVMKEVGFNGDLKSFFNHVRTKNELMPFTDAQEVVDNFNAIHDKMKPALKSMFDLVPKTAFEVRRTEAFREKSASAGYSQGAKDGSRPGIFYIPVPDVENYNLFSDESLFLHEAIPGHHFQISLQQENVSLPDFQRLAWYNAYGEGWALYCESLGKELGLYTDPYQYFGMLSAEMHRAIRLVIDVGIHAKGWTREEAIQYSLDHEAEPESNIISEVERYMAGPAQALSYKIGQLRILELRRMAESELGDAFNIKDFHNEVLESGCLPIELLDHKISQWIKTVKKSGESIN